MIRSTSHRRRLLATTHRSLAALAAVVLVTLLLVAACGSPTGAGGGSAGPGDPPAAPSSAATPTPTTGLVRVGSANFTENRLLAEIYASGLERRGVAVERRYSAGSREVYLPGMLDGSIDLVPEYTGNLLLLLNKQQATPTAPDQIYQQATAKLPPDLRLLAPAPAQDQDNVVVTHAFATANNLHSITDLARLCSTISFGGPPEFAQRAYGVSGLARTYGCTLREFRALDEGGPQTVAALRDGQIQAADLFTTDPSIAQNDFVVLTDPRAEFPAQNVVPLISTATTSDPRISEVLGRISSALTTPVLAGLDRRLAGPDRPDTTQVARDWLTSIGIR